ncbi:MAG: adenine phosphoribosyltransferase, partial [Gemmatimonadaceae bacterium]
MKPTEPADSGLDSALGTRVRRALRDVPDFPKPGIVFKDITPVLADAALFAEVTS